VIVAQANGTVGYIPTEKAFAAETYEAVYAPRIYGVQTFKDNVAKVFADAANESLWAVRTELRDELRGRNAKSREWRERSLKVVRGGCQGHKAPQNLNFGAPAFMQRAQGAHLWDVDGNEYIDYLMSYGPIVLGHSYPDFDAAIHAQMKKGTIHDVEFPEMVQLSEKLVEIIPCAEMCAYFVGGSGAASGAVTLARAHTQRPKVIRCGYHGWHPWTQAAGHGGTPTSYGMLTLGVPYNNLEALEKLLKDNEGEVAGMIIESVQGSGPSEGYFDGVRKLADDYDCVFILDEVKTGFRFALGGAQEYFGIKPDLACFGKAMCNGYPGSVVVGKKEVMESGCWLAGTFHADAISTAAALATIDLLEKKDGIAHQWRLGQRLIDGMNDIFKTAGVGLEVSGFPCLAAPRSTSPDYARLHDRFIWYMMAEGVYMTGHPWFLSLSHSDEDIDLTVEKCAAALKKALT